MHPLRKIVRCYRFLNSQNETAALRCVFTHLMAHQPQLSPPPDLSLVVIHSIQSKKIKIIFFFKFVKKKDPPTGAFGLNRLTVTHHHHHLSFSFLCVCVCVCVQLPCVRRWRSVWWVTCCQQIATTSWSDQLSTTASRSPSTSRCLWPSWSMWWGNTHSMQIHKCCYHTGISC